MASITFPPSPNPGDTVTDPDTGSVWLWDGTKWTFQPGSGSGGGQSPIVFSPVPPSPPVQGAMWWNTDVSKLYVYDGAQWVVVINTAGGAGGSGAFLPLTGGALTGIVTSTESIVIGQGQPTGNGEVVSIPPNDSPGNAYIWQPVAFGSYSIYGYYDGTNLRQFPGTGTDGINQSVVTLVSGTNVGAINIAPPVADNGVLDVVTPILFDTTGNSFLSSVVIPLQTAGSNIGQLSFNSIHANGVWTYQADGAAGVIQIGAANLLYFYVAPVGTAGAEFSDWVGILGMSSTNAYFYAPLSTPGLQFAGYSNDHTWQFDWDTVHFGTSCFVINIDGSTFIVPYGIDDTPNWYPLGNWAAAGGGGLAQGNLAIGGGYINWPTNYSSDRRIKSNIKLSDFDAESAVNAIQIWAADWAETGDVEHIQNHHDCCFIADEVEMVIPRAVINNPEPDKPAIINPLHLVSVLWKAVQDLSAKVQALEAR